jgi:hypothetical protein
MSARKAITRTDSEVVSGQVEKSTKARNPELQKYLHKVRRVEASFLGITTKTIAGRDNGEADGLAKATARSAATTRGSAPPDRSNPLRPGCAKPR